ncbi:unnamed protein product [Plutella xylostella]|uniref:(diamondback moth) hypothetical protein n=1 Tax=Plutella xylostella TaxID=51655 RepID=A0A8S4DBQ3_PLUXY|nr:unnamed protein product [Plutella xylostella]
MSAARSKPRPRRRDNLHERKQDLLLAWSDEVCNNDEVPEVEIVSLLQEHIPKYRLRADSITQFGGYENQDWFIPSPALPVSDADLKLTPDQIRETLNYFLPLVRAGIELKAAPLGMSCKEQDQYSVA